MLFDALATDFAILGAWLVQFGGHQPLSGSPAQQGAGLLLGHRLSPPNKVQIKVRLPGKEGGSVMLWTWLQISLKPRSGVLGQLVVFDFGSCYLVRGLSVHVLNEVEKKQMVNIGYSQQNLRPAKP